MSCLLCDWQGTDEECEVTNKTVKLLLLLKVDSSTCGDFSSSLAPVDGHSKQIFLYRIDLMLRRDVKHGAETIVTVSRIYGDL